MLAGASSPDFVRGFHYQPQLRKLLVNRQGVTFNGRRKTALWAQETAFFGKDKQAARARMRVARPGASAHGEPRERE